MYWFIGIVFVVLIVVVTFSISKALYEFKKIVKEDEANQKEDKNNFSEKSNLEK